MITLYQLLGVSETAPMEEIEAAFKIRASNEKDEKRINQLRMASEILLDDQKRKKYDSDLANYRAKQLLNSINTNYKVKENKEEAKDTKFDPTKYEDIPKEEPVASSDAAPQDTGNQGAVSVAPKQAVAQETVTDEDDGVEQDFVDNLKKEYEEAQAKQIETERVMNSVKESTEKYTDKVNKKLLKEKQREEKRKLQEMKDAYKEAYVAELRKRGYNAKYPWTRKRIKNLLITIVVTILVAVIAWQIPAVRNPLIEVYESNQFIKIFVDIIIGLFKSIFGIFIKK